MASPSSRRRERPLVMAAERQACGLGSLLSLSCRDRAEAFARRLQSRLQTLGRGPDPDLDPGADPPSAATSAPPQPQGDTGWLAGPGGGGPPRPPQPQQRLASSSDSSDLYFDFDLEPESPGSPAEDSLELVVAAAAAEPESGCVSSHLGTSPGSDSSEYFDPETGSSSPPGPGGYEKCNGHAGASIESFEDSFSDTERKLQRTTSSTDEIENLLNSLAADLEMVAHKNTLRVSPTKEEANLSFTLESACLEATNGNAHCVQNGVDQAGSKDEAEPSACNSEVLIRHGSESEAEGSGCEGENEGPEIDGGLSESAARAALDDVCVFQLKPSWGEDEDGDERRALAGRLAINRDNLATGARSPVPLLLCEGPSGGGRAEDEEEEEESPRNRLRRCSSLKSGKTPPGTPGRKKIVRFADVLGLDLADVRTFLDEIPRIPSSAYSDLREADLTLGSAANPVVANPSPAVEGPLELSLARPSRSLVPLFQQPGGQPDFLDLVRERQVCLENAIIKDPVTYSIAGVVRVRNLDFNKSVHVRYSLDRWATYADLQATYMVNSCDGFSDKFSFVLFAHTLAVGQRLEFAVRFQCKGSQFWDNNDGANYVFQCLPATNPTPFLPLPSPEDRWSSFY